MPDQTKVIQILAFCAHELPAGIAQTISWSVRPEQKAGAYLRYGIECIQADVFGLVAIAR